MGFVQLLERKDVIRIFGAVLITAPFINLYVSFFAVPGHPFSINFLNLQHMWIKTPWTLLVLYCTSTVLGLFMWLFEKKAWTFVLILLGIYIAKQITTLGPDLRVHWMAGVFFATNLLVFLFIADQLVFKQKPSKAPGISPPVPDNVVPIAAAKPAVTTTPGTYKKVWPIHLPGKKNWGRILTISEQGIRVQIDDSATNRAPPEAPIIRLGLGTHLRPRLVMTHFVSPFCYFQFYDLTAQEQQELRAWLQKAAAG